MEEKHSVAPQSQVTIETDFPANRAVQQAETGADIGSDLNAGGEVAVAVVEVGNDSACAGDGAGVEETAEEGSNATDTKLAVIKKKRGRPRRYSVDDGTVSLKSPAKGFSSSLSEGSSKRGRGRPRGSGKLQLLASLGGFAAEIAGRDFTTYIVTVQTGEDVVSKLSSFSQRGPGAIFIISCTGILSNVIIHGPSSSAGIMRYEGHFEILSLSGSFTYGVTGAANRKTAMLSVSLAKPNGQVFGGAVAGLLIAAGPIQIIVGSFKQKIYKKHKRGRSAESSTAASGPSSADLVEVFIQNGKMIDADVNYETPPSSFLEPTHGGLNVMVAGNQNVNPASLQNVCQNTLQQHSQAMSDQRSSPDLNVSVPEM